MVVRVADDEHLPLVLRVSGDRVIGRPRRRVVRLAFPALEPASAFVSSFGAMVEVLEPSAVRAELTQLYARPERPKKKAGRLGDRPAKVSSATQA